MEAARRRAHQITCACLQNKAPGRPMLMPNKTWSTWVRKWTMIWRLMGTGKTLLTEIISQILGASDRTITRYTDGWSWRGDTERFGSRGAMRSGSDRRYQAIPRIYQATPKCIIGGRRNATGSRYSGSSS